MSEKREQIIAGILDISRPIFGWQAPTAAGEHDPLCAQHCPGPMVGKCRGGDCTLCDEADCSCELIAAVEARHRPPVECTSPDGPGNGECLCYQAGHYEGKLAAEEATTPAVTNSGDWKPYTYNGADTLAGIRVRISTSSAPDQREAKE